jgi:hypothetical protein
LHAELQLPFDAFGMDFRTRTIQHFNHVVLRVNGRVWWMGTVETIAPKLAVPETVTLTAKGYAYQANDAVLTWSFARNALKTAGDIGEIPGVVRTVWRLVPLVFGTEEGKPNPLASTLRVEGSVVRPRGLVFDNVSVWEILTNLAELAGNYDWGVDENRQLFFVSPQPFTVGTAIYTAHPAQSIWTAQYIPSQPERGTYGDESYANPDPAPPHLPVAENAVAVVGYNVQELTQTDSVQLSKNTLIVVATARKVGDQPTIVSVSDPEWLDFWDRKLTARISTPFFSEEEDVRAWALRRLRLLGRPQVTGTVKVRSPGTGAPIYALGAMRLIDTTTGREIEERILSVKYSYGKDDHLLAEIEFGYQPPADQYFADQLRRDATLAQNEMVGERVPFSINERVRWPRDAWTAELVG